MINSKASWSADCCAKNYKKYIHDLTGITFLANGKMIITTTNEKSTFCSRKFIPPSCGSRDCAVTAENVVKPAQNPGSKSRRNWLIPRRSIKTKRAEARATPTTFAIKVPWRSLEKIKPMPYRDRVPAIPPIETKSKEFRIG